MHCGDRLSRKKSKSGDKNLHYVSTCSAGLGELEKTWWEQRANCTTLSLGGNKRHEQGMLMVN